jgi:hypothetical protein
MSTRGTSGPGGLLVEHEPGFRGYSSHLLGSAPDGAVFVFQGPCRSADGCRPRAPLATAYSQLCRCSGDESTQMAGCELIKIDAVVEEFVAEDAEGPTFPFRDRPSAFGDQQVE